MLGLLVFATVLALALIVVAALPPLPARNAPRRRRTVGPRVHALARHCGFRHSYMRDALVLRGVGRRWGPVLRLREDARAARAADDGVDDVMASSPGVGSTRGASSDGDDDAASGGRTASSGSASGGRAANSGSDLSAGKPPAHERGDDRVERAGQARLTLTEPLTLPTPRPRDAAARTIDVVCMPLPRPHHAHRLWQLTAVELESLFVWVELTRTRGEPPPPQLAARFVRDIRKDLEARGLRLDAILVRSGGTQRWPQLGAGDDSVPLLRLPPGRRHERVAANMHARAVGGFWQDVFARDEIGSLDTLRRALDEWARRRNEAALASVPSPVGGR